MGATPTEPCAVRVSVCVCALSYELHGRDRGHRQGLWRTGATVHTTGVGVTAGGDPNVSAVRGMDVAAASGSHRGVRGSRAGDPVTAAMP